MLKTTSARSFLPKYRRKLNVETQILNSAQRDVVVVLEHSCLLKAANSLHSTQLLNYTPVYAYLTQPPKSVRKEREGLSKKRKKGE